MYTVLFCAGFLLLASVTENGCTLKGNSQLTSVLQSPWNAETGQEELRNIEVRLVKALSLSPYNSYIYFLLADVNNRMGNEEAADRYYKKAIRLNPTQATYLQNYGFFLNKKGEYSLADSLMQAGIRHDRNEPNRKRKYARFLFNANENEKGLQVMTDVFGEDSKNAAFDIAFLVDAGFSDADIRRILPDKTAPLLAFADFLDQKGDQEQAAVLYRQALAEIVTEKVVVPDYFFKVSMFFREQERYEEALDVIMQAITLFPAHADLRVAAGNLYGEMGLTHRAIEEYRVALAIDAGSSEARKRLAFLQQNADLKNEL